VVHHEHPMAANHVVGQRMSCSGGKTPLALPTVHG
jgi:hypothetical protein